MKTLNGLVFVRPVQVEQKRASGLVIPDAAQERPTQGVVVHTCDGAPVSVGDTVLFSRYVGQDVEVDGEKLIALKTYECLAVVEYAQ